VRLSGQKKLFSQMDNNQDTKITYDEFAKIIMLDSSPRTLLYNDFNNVLEPYVNADTITYENLTVLLKQLTSKTSKTATIIKNSKDSLVATIKNFPSLSPDQLNYLDTLNDMSLDEVENEMDFLTVAGSYCSHLLERFYYLMTDNEDCIIKDYLKLKTTEYEDQSKKKRVKAN
jgi:hypothetical protein